MMKYELVSTTYDKIRKKGKVPVFVNRNVIFLFFVFVFYILYRAISFGGPDYDHYLDWGNVFSSGNIEQLHSTVLSPLGVPMSQWSFGPGLLYAIGAFFQKNVEAGGKLICFILIVFFWIGFTNIIWKYSKNNTAFLAVGLIGAFIGTPLGHYTFTQSSEIISACSLLFGYYFILVYRPRLSTVFTSGTSFALLIITRQQLIIYILPILFLLFFRIAKLYRLTYKSLLFVFVFLLPISLGLVMSFFNNRWMTGHFSNSPYTFGNTIFKSVDFIHPLFSTILFHPWRGLLTYHPLFGIMAVSVILLIIRRPKIEKIFFSLILLSVLLHLYLQAAWYVWWLGTFTFGMRGMIVSGVILTPIFIYYLSVTTSSRERNIMILLSCLACIWSFGLMYVNTNSLALQQGYIQCKLFIELLATQIRIIKRLLIFENIFLVIGSIFLYFFIIPKRQTIENVAEIFLTALFFLFLIDIFKVVAGPSYQVLFSFFKIVLTFILPFLFTYSILIKADGKVSFFRFTKYIYKKYHLLLIHGYGMLSLIFLISIVILFIRVGIRTENIIKNGGIKQDRFSYKAPFYIPEVVESYHEYLSIQGFEKEKMRLGNYISKFDAFAISEK